MWKPGTVTADKRIDRLNRPYFIPYKYNSRQTQSLFTMFLQCLTMMTIVALPVLLSILLILMNFILVSQKHD